MQDLYHPPYRMLSADYGMQHPGTFRKVFVNFLPRGPRGASDNDLGFFGLRI